MTSTLSLTGLACIATLCLGSVACSKPPPGAAPEATPKEATVKQTPSEEQAKARITRRFVEQFDGADAGEVVVTFHDYGLVPGARVFAAVTRQPGLREKPRVGLRGVVTADRIVTEPGERLDALVAAWGPDKLKAVDPTDFARLAAGLEATGRDGVEALTEPLTLANYRQSKPEVAAQMFMPRRARIDGAYAVEYYALSPVPDRQGPTRVVVDGGGHVTRYKQAADGTWKLDGTP